MAQDEGNMMVHVKRLWFEGGVVVAMLGMAFYVGSWKASQEQAQAEMQQQLADLSQQLAAVAARPITSEADRRLSVVESQISAQVLTVSELKVDIGKRLDRLEQQNDTILRELRARR